MTAGRPTKYDPDYHPEHAYKLAMLSHTDEEMAAFFEINTDTFYEWKRRYPEFSEAVTRGKIPADAEVAASFFKRATGYDQPTEKLFLFEGEVIRADTVTHYPPDPGAALNWLKNRQPDKWRDKKQLELDADVDGAPVAFPIVRVYSPKPDESDAA
ncbi:helix-turn-helix domain-containing protein [Microvirga zambiensis]|uniref:helix-turn-helix domain-containing protein n=1 Tax=Microvirga zambiensis TaxID=1402137 RepID=UPI00191E3D0A|nr:helix-turn-helix domain-containing protein [Microvirga zambiensis]